MESTGLEDALVVFGFQLGPVTTSDVLKISLHRANTVAHLDDIPTVTDMRSEAAAAVDIDVFYITGVGSNMKEVWKYNLCFYWHPCGSLNQGRRRHGATCVDGVLYVYGGSSHPEETVLDSVEIYNVALDACAIVGRLVTSVYNFASVAYGRRIYVFGGVDEHSGDVDHVQMYDTVLNVCTLLSKPMPRPERFMRAALWEKSVFLLGHDTAFIFDLKTELWRERQQFKTGVDVFGLVVGNDHIFIVGGRSRFVNNYGIPGRRKDVRCIPVRNFFNDTPVKWKFHAKLPGRSTVSSFVVGSLRFTVERETE